MPPKEPAEPAGPAAELQQQKKAVPSRKRVHKADPEWRSATRRAIEPQVRPMAAAAAFWTATPVAVAPDAGNAAASNAGGPAIRERAGRKAPVRVTTSDSGAVIKSSF